MRKLSEQFKDIEGNLLAQQHNTPRPMHGHLGDLDEDDLEFDYQVRMVNEAGARNLNSMQRHLNANEPTVADDD
jgi:hypothetical protein